MPLVPRASWGTHGTRSEEGFLAAKAALGMSGIFLVGEFVRTWGAGVLCPYEECAVGCWCARKTQRLKNERLASLRKNSAGQAGGGRYTKMGAAYLG